MSAWVIYSLIDPRDQQPRYIGSSIRLRKRILEHVADALRLCANDPQTAKDKWIRSLAASGMKPSSSILEEGSGDSACMAAEKRWISHFRNLGIALTNSTKGGEGVIPTDTRRRLAEIARQRCSTPEGRAQMAARGARNRGKAKSPEAIAHTAAANRGKKRTGEKLANVQRVMRENSLRRTPEAEARRIAAVRTALTGIPRTPEVRQRMSTTIAARRGARRSS